ncbi:MAG TPA: type 1 glutamine amidotransferase [Cytophagaceae bacterium]|jgi:GMP synthase-like glutamine amidotransferase|nr:type 1 glutamine amidotransferase [Cytophagaceae bacterium]
MNIHFLQHVPFEDLGALEKWVMSPGNRVSATRLYEDSKLPFVDLFDVLIVLGGPMSVHDEDRYRWLLAEKELIRKALDKGKKVIGICLGAQLIAEVLEATVSLNPVSEIGWFNVELSDEALKQPAFAGFTKSIPAFHWHGETFGIPAQAIAIGQTPACKHQGFLWNNQALALQFHLEITAEEITGLLHHCREDLKEGPYVQPAGNMIRPDLIAETNRLIFQLVDNFIGA